MFKFVVILWERVYPRKGRTGLYGEVTCRSTP